MSLAPGSRLGAYEVRSLIGAGGMGEVYLARDLRLNRTVALKILPEELSSEPLRLERFNREAKSAASLNHPNICTIYEVGIQNTRSFICMEYVQGITLRERIDIALEHARGMVAYEEDGSPLAEQRALRSLRGQLPLYIKGEHGAAQIRGRLSTVDSVSELEEILEEFALAVNRV